MSNNMNQIMESNSRQPATDLELENNIMLANSTGDSIVQAKPRTILCMGPVGGTLGGAVTLFQVTREGLANWPNVKVEVIDTAPPPNYYGYKKSLINTETASRARRIVAEYRKKIGQADAVLFFANRELALIIGPLLSSMARRQNKPFFLKTIAGDLAMGLAEAKAPMRRYALAAMNSFTGVMAETQLLQAEIEALGYAKVHYIPNCRREVDIAPAELAPQQGKANLVFVSQINLLKGVFVILDALHILHEQGYTEVTCDFYGPIFGDIEAEFLEKLEQTPGARYFGVLPMDEVLATMRTYEGLVLPTYHSTEGHPGIIIEAMQIGVPVISTQLRAIPELITHGENGLLVEPQNAKALAEAMAFWADNPDEVVRMGKAHYARRAEFSASHVTAATVALMLPTE